MPKKVITGFDEAGASVFIDEGRSGRDFAVPALAWEEIWATFPKDNLSACAALEDPTTDKRWRSAYPKPGETRLRVLEFRPEESKGSQTGEPIWDEQDIAVLEREAPGVIASLEPDNPGMHRTNSVDYGVVIEGRIELELDDNKRATLHAGDVVVQNGTRHAWHPLEKTRMLFVMVGVQAD